MSYEFSHPHAAWQQRVTLERAKSDWFYETLSREFQPEGRSQRWKQLADVLHHPSYSTNYEFMSSRGCLSGRGREEVLSKYAKDVTLFQGRVQSLLERPKTGQSKAVLRLSQPLPTIPSLQKLDTRSYRQSARGKLRNIERQLREEQTKRRHVDTALSSALQRK